MKALIQRVKNASVTIDGEVYSSIGKGLLVFLGVEKADEPAALEYIGDKILKLRIFEDEAGKMNFSIKDINGEMLIVSQFTLAGSTKKGCRPSFDNAMPPEKAKIYYEKFIELCKASGISVKTGVFGAMMDIGLINDGPVTFMVEK